VKEHGVQLVYLVYLRHPHADGGHKLGIAGHGHSNTALTKSLKYGTHWDPGSERITIAATCLIYNCGYAVTHAE